MSAVHQKMWSAETEDKLVRSAIEGREMAYCRYSEYAVGAAVLTEDGTIINGCNVENAAYGSTMCAERTAIFSAVAKGHRVFQAIVVITKDGKGTPCGCCRQVINEFSPDAVILTADPGRRVSKRIQFSQLLPDAFGPHNLTS